MMQQVNIQWQTVQDFQAAQGFLKRKVPGEYHISEAEAFQLLLAQPLPHELVEALTLDPDVQVWGLRANGEHAAALWVGLPQFHAEGYV